MDYTAKTALGFLHQDVTDLEGSLQQLRSALAAQPQPLTLDQIKAALQASGVAALNPVALTPGTGGGAGVTVYEGTHADRLALSTTGLAAGTIFLETDRSAVYDWTQYGYWQCITGWGVGSSAGRFADLGAHDDGMRYTSQDFQYTELWTGARWKWCGGTPYRGTFGAMPVLQLEDADVPYIATDKGNCEYRWDATALAWFLHSGILRDTFVNRPTTNIDSGAQFQATDKTGIRWVYVLGTGWIYAGGTYLDTAANLAAFAASLGANDTGLLSFATDTYVRSRWGGAAWVIAYLAAPDLSGDIGGALVGKFGCNGQGAQAAYASGGALAGYVTGAFGLDSDAHMHDLYNMVVAIRAALVANGVMS